MKTRVVPVSHGVLGKMKERFRERCKGVGEDWKLLEVLAFHSDFRDGAVPRNDRELGGGCGIRLWSGVEESVVWR